MITLVAALDENILMGNSSTNDLPWRINGKNLFPGDMKRFKQLTEGGTVVMGRGTFESMRSKPLPNRTNIVLSKTLPRGYRDGVFYYNDVIELLLDYFNSDFFVIGGHKLYSDFLKANLVDKAIITRLPGTFDGDIFFPLNLMRFTSYSTEHVDNFKVVTYVR